MAKKTSAQSWVPLTYQGITIHIPMNRAARQAYKRKSGSEWLMPPVLKPYVKEAENATEIRQEQKNNKL